MKPDSPAAAMTADHELLAQFRATRSETAFRAIVARHGGMVYRACLRLTRSHQEAEDASQATFLILAQRPNAVDRTLAGWLHKVARDTVANLIRARERQKRREQKAASMSRTSTTTADGSLREELDAALNRLPTQLREAVILRYLEEHSVQDAAAMAGCPEGTLGWRAMEGLNRLRNLLTRRGVMVAPAVLVGFMAQEAAAATPTAALGAMSVAGAASAVAASSPAAVLAKATTDALFWAKAKLASVFVALTLPVAAVPLLLPPTPTDTPLYGVRRLLTGHTSHVQSVVVTPDGATAISSSSDQSVRVWDVASGTQRGEIPVEWPTPDHPITLALAPDGRTLAIGSFRGMVTLWDVVRNEKTRVIGWTVPRLQTVARDVVGLAFSRDGQFLACAYRLDGVVIWDLANERQVRGPTDKAQLSGIAFDGTGKFLAVSGTWGPNLRTINAATGEAVRTIERPVGGVYALAISPSGSDVAFGAGAGTEALYIADVATQQVNRTMQPAGPRATHAVAWAPDGQRIAAGRDDGLIRLYDLAVRKPIAQLTGGHLNAVTALAFTPDGSSLISGGSDQKIVVWKVAE